MLEGLYENDETIELLQIHSNTETIKMEIIFEDSVKLRQGSSFSVSVFVFFFLNSKWLTSIYV